MSIFSLKRSKENREFFISLLTRGSIDVLVEGAAVFLTAADHDTVSAAYANSLLGIFSANDLEEIGNYNSTSGNFSLGNILVAATFGLPRATILNIEKFTQILQKEEIIDEDIINLTASLHAVFQAKESRAYIPVLIEYFNNKNIQSLESIQTKSMVIFLILALYTVWSELFYIPLAGQKVILKKLYCLSGAIGVPVQYMLEQSAKKQSTTIENYIYYIAFLTEGLKENQEKIKDGEKEIIFGSIVQQISTSPDISIAPDFAQSLVLAKKILKGELLDTSFFDQKDKSLQYAEDMQKLILWFFVKPLWSEIVDYYSGKDPVVPMRVFLRELTNHDILNDESVERYTEFSSFLQENNLLSKEIFLVLFNESTGEFEWNHELLN